MKPTIPCQSPTHSSKWPSALLLTGLILAGSLNTTQAEIGAEKTIPDFPHAAISAAQKRASEARLKLLSATQGKSAQPEIVSQSSLLLSQINSATAEASKLRQEWIRDNKDKILTQLKDNQESLRTFSIEAQNRLKKAQDAAEKAMQHAKTQRQTAQEITQRRAARLQTAQNAAQNARQQMTTAQQSIDSTWLAKTTSLEDMIQIDKTIAAAKESLAAAEQEIELAQTEEANEQQEAIRQAETLEKQAQEAHQAVQNIQKQNQLEDETLKTQLTRTQHLADQLTQTEQPANNTLAASHPATVSR